jgi:hypothetical protein
MNLTRKHTIVSCICFGFLLVGCRKPGPVELVVSNDPDVFEVQSVAGGPDFGNEHDTTGLTADERAAYFGHMLVSGIRYDNESESRSIVLARAFFLDRTQPVLRNGRTIGYRGLDVGNMFIDNLPLPRVPWHIRFSSIGGIGDTVVGVQYELASRDGIGIITYKSRHPYRWRSVGGSISLDQEALSANALQVTKPVPADVLSKRNGFSVEWTGGEDIIHLTISEPQTGREPRPLIRMKVRNRNGRAFVPAKVLRMLPNVGSNRFVLSFVSQRRDEAHVTGFSDAVLVHSASIHNISLIIR